MSIVRLPTDQSDAATRAPQGTPLHVDAEIEVPGHTLRARRIPEMRDEGFFFRYFHGVDEMVGAGAAVSARGGVRRSESEDGARFDLVAYFQRPGSSHPITDEEVAAFLEPFDLWRPPVRSLPGTRAARPPTAVRRARTGVDRRGERSGGSRLPAPAVVFVGLALLGVLGASRHARPPQSSALDGAALPGAGSSAGPPPLPWSSLEGPDGLRARLVRR